MCKAMFDEIDKNKNGFLEFEEIKVYMEAKGQKCCGKCKEMFEKFDKNHDGKLCYEEFHEMMKEIYSAQKCDQKCDQKECCDEKKC